MTANGLVEVETCQVCGSGQRSAQFEEPPYRVLRCDGCGLVYVTPRLSGEALRKEVYGDSYWKSDKPREQGYADYIHDEPLYLKTFRRRLRLVERQIRGKVKVLDVGCAAGYFLRVMKEAGHRTFGIEVSAPIAAHARRHLGDDAIWVGGIEDLPADRPGFEPGSFDLITLWDVVEHVPDPQALLRHVRPLLAPGGTLILETQNVDSGFANLLGRRWHHYKHEEHLYHFNPATVRSLLEQTGFEVVHNTPRFGGKYVSLSFIAERAGRLHGALSWMLKPMALLRGANVYVNFRDEMVVVARAAAAAEPAVTAMP